MLITYTDKRKAKDGSKIDTVSEIINRWAPPVENNTRAYAAHVRKLLDVEKGEVINLKTYETCYTLVRAIIVHENGFCPYDKKTIDTGLERAGIDVPVKPLTQSRTMRGGTAAATGTVGTAAMTAAPAIETVKDQLEPLLRYSDTLLPAFLAVSLLGIAVTLWARRDDYRKRWK